MANDASLMVLNNAESYLEIKKFGGLKFGKQHKVLSFEMKKGPVGKRICLLLCELESMAGEVPVNFLHYLPPSFADQRKHESLASLMKKRGRTLLFMVESVKKGTNDMQIPVYKFDCIRNELLSNIMTLNLVTATRSESYEVDE